MAHLLFGCLWKNRSSEFLLCFGTVRARTITSSTRAMIFDKHIAESPTSKLKRSFQLLDLVQDECTEEEIRKAYIRLAKKYHPDSSSSEANAERFSEVREAYKKCMSYAKNVTLTRDIYAALEKDLSDLDEHLGYTHSKQRRLPHRQYLSYDTGTGTVSQRQRAYTQQRVNQAMDNVFEKQFQKALENPEAKEITPYQGGPKSKVPGGKTTKSLQRIANEIIYDSMKKGDFDNLKGRGRPLDREPINPVLDNMEQMINKMLSNSGFAPEWITLDKEIRAAIDRLRADIAHAWSKCGPYPMDLKQAQQWEKQLLKFEAAVESINKKVFNLNLIVPTLNGQRMNLRLDQVLSKTIESSPTPPLCDEEPVTETHDDSKQVTESDPLGSLVLRFMSTVKQRYHHVLSRWQM